MSTTDPQAGVPPVVHRLDYGRQPSRLSRWWRRLRGPALFLIVAGICYAVRGPIVQRAKQLYWQRRCLEYVNAGDPVALPSPGLPVEWVWYLRDAGMKDNVNMNFDPQIVYLGRMQRPDGVERIVRLHEESFVAPLPGFAPGTGDPEISIIAYVMRPATVLRRAIQMGMGAQGIADSITIKGKWPRVRGAVIDPANASHLTIQAMSDDRGSRVLDVNLDNSDNVQFSWCAQ